MDRRAFLKGSLVAASTPAVVLAPERHQETIARLVVADDHAAPFANQGDVVVYDEAENALEQGATYVTRTDTSRKPFVARAWHDTDGRWWIERFARSDWYGPISEDTMRRVIQGRVKAVWKTVA